MIRSIRAFGIILIIALVVCGGRKEEPGAQANSPPAIENVTLLPLHPTVQSEITARILASDRNGDPITYQVRWFVNDVQIGEGMSFAYPEIKRGDKVFAEVTPYDGKEYGAMKRSGEVTIGGLQPRIISVSVIPDVVYTNTPEITLNAAFEGTETEGMKLIVHWLVNDEVLPDTSNVLSMQRLGLKKNEVITGVAFADDGEHRSDGFPFEITIANAPPAFKTKIDSVKTSTDRVHYVLPIYDPDNDPLRFEILQAPEGIMVERDEGIIYGTTTGLSVFEVLVRATDPEGAYLDAQFTLTAK